MNPLNVLFFQLGKKKFGIEIEAVQEIIKLERAQHVPLAPPFLDRIINVRGRIISILYLNRLFKIEAENGPEPRVLALRSEEIQTGIYVDSVSGIKFMKRSSLNPVPETLLKKNAGRFFKGELDPKKNGEGALLLDQEPIVKFLMEAKM